VDQDNLAELSRFAKTKTLHYDMRYAIFSKKISIGKFFTNQVLGSVSCKYAAMEKT
jgi:hypothetical protein